MSDPYRGVADELVEELAAANGDPSAEELALKKAIKGYLDIAGGGEPAELGLAEYFAQEGSVESPPALERVPGATDQDIERWSDLLADLAGY
ncbi:MAG: hypothetical protein R3B07_18950 [Polyangiaceae bacterium]